MGRPEAAREELDEVGQAGLVLGVVAHLAVCVGDGLADLLDDVVRTVREVDRAEGRAHRLRHLALRVLQVHDPGGDLGHDGLGDDEGLAVAAVEPDRHVAGELQVLALVVADGDLVGVVEHDVGCHEHGIGEKAGGDRLGALALLLELGHAPQLAETRRALEQPAEPGVLGDVALHEHRADLRVEPAREEPGGGVEGTAAQLGRVLFDRQGVQVDHAEDRVGLVLVDDPLAEGPEIVADVRRARRLHPGKDPLHRKKDSGRCPEARDFPGDEYPTFAARGP